MKITYSESKEKFGNIGKGVDHLSGFQGQSKVTQIKRKGMPLINISKKGLSKSIREFEKLPYESYEKKRPKHEPTNSYLYLARQICKVYDEI